ncbi:MAG: isoamylase early set domain-containing protein [Gemmatimonadales bacterium]
MNDDNWLERVSSELRAPVRVDAAFEGRVVAAVRRSVRRRRWAVAGCALGTLVLLLAVLPQLRPRLAGTEVEFTIELPAATAVAVVGDFNDWDRARTPLAPNAAGTRWSARVPLAGGVYHYAFLVDGQRWVADPRQAVAIDGDYGQTVSMVTVQ